MKIFKVNAQTNPPSLTELDSHTSWDDKNDSPGYAFENDDNGHDDLITAPYKLQLWNISYPPKYSPEKGDYTKTYLGEIMLTEDEERDELNNSSWISFARKKDPKKFEKATSYSLFGTNRLTKKFECFMSGNS